MDWSADPSPGEWLRERLDAGHATMHGVVPRGFPAYARVFHPASVRSLPGRAVPTQDEYERMPGDRIRAICADAGIEALPLREGADLTWHADEVNR